MAAKQLLCISDTASALLPIVSGGIQVSYYVLVATIILLMFVRSLVHASHPFYTPYPSAMPSVNVSCMVYRACSAVGASPRDRRSSQRPTLCLCTRTPRESQGSGP